MAPKAKKGAQSSGAKGDKDEKREEPLQAVVLTDSYETKFSPFTLEQPRCLLPLANTPLIEYTLEFLASNGIEEVYLYCGNHTDQVEDYIQHSRWVKDTAPFALEIIRSTSRSIGDAMRDLDQKQLLTGDFICVYGDVVSNVQLEVALRAHRTRREKDKRAIMTMLLRESAPQQHKVQTSRPVFVIDPAKDRCLHYEQLRRGEKSPRLNLEAEILTEHTELDVRTDLQDCGIDICTPEVLSQWSEGFDWETPRRGFLYGVLKDHELNNLTIHTHIVADGYAARVRNLPAYDTISQDIVSRWTYPVCPDMNMLPDQSFQLTKRNIYKEDGVVLARSSDIQKRSVLGRGTSVGEGTTIKNSIIGRRCIVGKRTRIDGAYIWDDVHIGDDCVIETSIIAAKTSISNKCHIKAGALISYDVDVPNGTMVESNSKLSRSELPSDADADEDLEPLFMPTSLYGKQGFALSNESVSTLDSDAEEEEDIPAAKSSGRKESFASIGSEGSGEPGGRAAAHDFHHEAVSSIFDALQRDQDPNNIQLELKGLTLASNASGKLVRQAVAEALMKRITNLVEAGSSPQQAVNATIPKNKLLVERSVLDGKESDKVESVEFLYFMQNDLVHRPQGSKILFHSCYVLSTQDLIENEGFEQWWNDPRSSASDELRDVRAESERLVQTLAEDSEEESDEEEEEEDEEESDDD